MSPEENLLTVFLHSNQNRECNLSSNQFSANKDLRVLKFLPSNRKWVVLSWLFFCSWIFCPQKVAAGAGSEEGWRESAPFLQFSLNWKCSGVRPRRRGIQLCLRNPAISLSLNGGGLEARLDRLLNYLRFSPNPVCSTWIELYMTQMMDRSKSRHVQSWDTADLLSQGSAGVCLLIGPDLECWNVKPQSVQRL